MYGTHRSCRSLTNISQTKKVFNVLVQMKDEIKSPSMTELSTAAQDLVNSSVMFKSLKDQSLTPEQALKAAADELRKQKKSNARTDGG